MLHVIGALQDHAPTHIAGCLTCEPRAPLCMADCAGALVVVGDCGAAEVAPRHCMHTVLRSHPLIPLAILTCEPRAPLCEADCTVVGVGDCRAEVADVNGRGGGGEVRGPAVLNRPPARADEGREGRGDFAAVVSTSQ